MAYNSRCSKGISFERVNRQNRQKLIEHLSELSIHALASPSTNMANGIDLPSVVNGDGPRLPSPERDWETSPMYLALSTRLAKTESTLSSLSLQVTQLSQLVRSALPTALPPAHHVFSPFDPPVQSPFILTNHSSSSTPSDGSIAALTQQISALSTSVAQLQRLQQSQSQVSRQNSGSSSLAQGMTNGDRLPSMNMPRHLQDLISGPLTTPNGGMVTPVPVGSSRPNINRSMSSSVIGGGGKWGGGRDWPSPGPGGLLSPSGSINGGLGGAAAPGAGIVVTKWEHLNLKVELLRAILKYGYVQPTLRCLVC